jgi:hypothetical protein
MTRAPEPAVLRWLLRPSGSWAAAAWGFAEGTLFFVMPDLIITLTALFSIRHSLKQIATAVAGALVGGMLLYGLAAQNPASAKSMVLGVPFVKHRMFETVDREFRTVGAWAPCKGPTSGIPYKVYAVEATRHINWFLFLLVSIPARLERLVITWALFAALGRLCGRYIAAHPGSAITFHALYWVAVYGFYWSVI